MLSCLDVPLSVELIMVMLRKYNISHHKMLADSDALLSIHNAINQNVSTFSFGEALAVDIINVFIKLCQSRKLGPFKPVLWLIIFE